MVTFNTGSPVRLPYELFLDIIDAFIVQAECSASFIELEFFVDEEELLIDYYKPIDDCRHKDRFQQLCPALHINQDTRRMVLRKFQPIRFRQQQQGSALDSATGPSRRPEVVWALPSLDRFTPISEDDLLDLDTVMDTNSVKCIEFLDAVPDTIFDQDMEQAMDNVLSLPKLREINMGLSYHDTECREPESDEEPEEESFPIDEDLFSLLCINLSIEPWVNGSVLKSFLCRAAAQGVAIFGWKTDLKSGYNDKIVQISCASESEEIRMRFTIDSSCKCYRQISAY